MIKRFNVFEAFLESLFEDLNRVKRADIDPRYPWESKEERFEDYQEEEENIKKKYFFI